MLPVTTQQSNVLLGTTGPSAFKVEVKNAVGVFVDMSAFSVNGRVLNFLKSGSVEDSVDNLSAQASFVLAREFFSYNLSPLMAGSLLNTGGAAINLNRQVRISAARVPANSSASDFVQIFYGRIFEIDWGSGQNDITVSCTDMTGELLSLWNEAIIPIGSATGVLAESVMQTIMNTVSTKYSSFYLSTLWSKNGTVGTPFNSMDSPGWALKSGGQDQMALLTALVNISQQIGWLLRQKWSVAAGAFVLTWYDPTRGNVAPAWTFPIGRIKEVTKCGVHLGDIRNVVHVTYYDAALNFAPRRLVVADTTSIALYGRQFMQMAEEATSQINSVTQATLMAQGAISDLAQPNIDYVVTVPLFWPAEVADLYTFKADSFHFDSDQTLGLISWRHIFPQNGMATTELTMRGKPSGGVRVWFDRMYHNVRKQYGAYNSSPNTDLSTSVYPNSGLSQYSKV